MARKLFIVKRGNAQLFRSLASTLTDELDVLVICDRRNGQGRPFAGAPDRRKSSGVDDRLLADGFAVVRLTLESRAGNVRWAS